jgi:hypothetical protein
MGKYSKEEFIMKLQTPLRALTYSMPASTVSTEITWILYTVCIPPPSNSHVPSLREVEIKAKANIL